MALTDAELMLLLRQGDEDAFGELICRYQRQMVNFFYRLGWDYHLSEDLTQEVFLKVYKYRSKYEETARFQTFLYRIARNLWIDQIRKRKSRPAPVSLDKQVKGKDDAVALAGLIKDPRSGTPSRTLERQELDAAIQAAVSTLNEQEQMIFNLVSHEKMKYREIAEIMGIPEGTVKSKVYYTYRKLREKLEEFNPDEV